MTITPIPNRHAKQTRFLAALAQGRTPAEAAALTGVPLPTFYTWRTKHTRFRDAWNKAVAYGRTPDFPSASRLATINLKGPKTHWGWVPGGMPVVEPRQPDDWVALVLQNFCGGPDLVIYSVVQPDGASKEHCRRRADQPMPDGVEHPTYALEPDLMERLPPKPQPHRAIG